MGESRSALVTGAASGIGLALSGLLSERGYRPGGGPYAASKHAVFAVAEQAALELADTNIAVTVLCPALVRTGMSDEGEYPEDVAARALAAVDGRRFAVLPDEWAPAVEERAATLVSGRYPEVPTLES